MEVCLPLGTAEFPNNQLLDHLFHFSNIRFEKGTVFVSDEQSWFQAWFCPYDYSLLSFTFTNLCHFNPIKLFDVSECSDSTVHNTSATNSAFQYPFTRLASSHLTFDVKASSDVYLVLSAQNYDLNKLYYIIIGGWNGKRSMISKCLNGCIKKIVDHRVSVIDPVEWRSFWVSVSEDGLVSVGIVGDDAFMEWKDDEPLPVNYVGFMTGNGNSGQWRFCDLSEYFFNLGNHSAYNSVLP